MTMKAGVIGWPIAHSLSPALHSAWLTRYDIGGSYDAFPVEPGHLPQFIRTLKAGALRGVNVTIPHKEEVAKLMDRLDSVAAKLGAVNLVIAHDDGALEGRNTDGFGFLENVKAAGFLPKGADCLVLGAGGTTRAVTHALVQAGAKVTVSNRTQEKAEAIADVLGASVHPWADRLGALAGKDLLINTTSLGMAGGGTLDLDLEGLPDTAMVTDCVYAPLETPLLADARSRGLNAVDGLGMLIHQARPAFKAWFGVDPEVTSDLKELLVTKQKEMAS